jgi:phospholipid N-methyltransferase
MKERVINTILAIINENNDLLTDEEFEKLISIIPYHKRPERKQFNLKDRNELDKLMKEINAYLPIVSLTFSKKIKVNREIYEIFKTISFLKPFLKFIEEEKK